MKTPQEEAKYLIEKLGLEGAIRQTLEELGNADNHTQESHYRAVLQILRNS